MFAKHFVYFPWSENSKHQAAKQTESEIKYRDQYLLLLCANYIFVFVSFYFLINLISAQKNNSKYNDFLFVLHSINANN